jgi:hypothetical protein
MNPLIFKIKYQGHRVIVVATGSCFAIHIVTFLPITCTYHIVTLAENCMFESFLGVSHFYRFISHISRYLTLATIGQF